MLEHGLRDVVGVPVDGQLAAAERVGASGLPILADRPQAPVCKTVACSLITPGGPQRSLAPDLPIGLPLHSLYEITDSGRYPSHGAAPSTAQ